jgi:phage shock protein A
MAGMSDTDEPIDAEIVPAPPPVTPAAAQPQPVQPDYDEHGVPSLDYVRDKIEGRFATSLGTGELASETPQGRSLAEQEAEREKAAKAKLEEIRRSLGPG